jgi:hypothetical protein
MRFDVTTMNEIPGGMVAVPTLLTSDDYNACFLQPHALLRHCRYL